MRRHSMTPIDATPARPTAAHTEKLEADLNPAHLDHAAEIILSARSIELKGERALCPRARPARTYNRNSLMSCTKP